MNTTANDYLRRCPACWRNIPSTTLGNIARHWDSVGRDICPMGRGDLPYDLMEIGHSQRIPRRMRRTVKAGAA